MTAYLPPLVKALISIENAFQSTKSELDWLYNNSRSIEGYPNNPEATLNVTKRFHHVSSGMVCVYIFAIMEECLDPKSSEWNSFLQALEPNDKEKLKAFKHIRNTIAHGFNGVRAERDADKFNIVMSRNTESERIQSVISYDQNNLLLSDFAGMECYIFMQRIVHSALVKVAN